jgi:dTDP-4-dehydrorhamnose reductase
VIEELGKYPGPYLLIGGSGMLGRAFRELLTARRIAFDAPSHAVLDLTNADAVRSAVGKKYAAVINCAAWTDVDGAETKQAEADALNGTAVANFINACVAANSLLVHYSTDYVFQGSTTPLKVNAVRQPPNAYGRSKLLGEQAIENADPQSRHHLLLRTSWLYDAWGKNFVRTIANAAKTKPALKVVNDQRGRPTSCRSLARASLALILARANEHADDGMASQHRGTFHVTDGGECTWFDFATEIAAFANPACKVDPCGSDEYKRPAVRPAYSVMDLSRTEAAVGPMPHWKATLALVLRSLE